MTRPRHGAGRLLWQLLRTQRRAVVAGAASGVLWMTALAAVPAVVSRAVDAAVVQRDGPATARWLGLLGLVTVVHIVGGGARHWLACRLHYGTTSAVSARLSERIHDPRGGIVEPAGALVAVVTSDGPRVGSVADLMCRGSGALASLVLVGLVMVATSPPLALAVFVVIAAVLLASAPLLHPIERRTAEEQRERAVAAAVAADMIGGLRVLRGLGAVGAARSRFALVNDRARNSAAAAGRLQAVWEGVAVVMSGALLTVTLLVGGTLMNDGRLSVGQLLGFMTTAQFLLTPLATIVEVGDVWTRGLASSRRVSEVLDTAVPVDDAGRSAPATSPAMNGIAGPAVALVGVGTADGALDRCTFEVAAGEVVGIAAGDDRAAQAIARLLARAEDPRTGRVLIDGRPAPAWPLADLRARVVVEDGNSVLVTGSIRTNVAFGRPAATERAVRGALAIAGAEDILARSAQGLDAHVGESGRSLSGGQRQRVALARAVAAEPPTLVLVDPTSAVDVHTEQAIVERVIAATRRGGACIVVITTSAAFLAAADRVIHVHDGRVGGTGEHRSLLGRSDIYRRLVMPHDVAVVAE